MTTFQITNSLVKFTFSNSNYLNSFARSIFISTKNKPIVFCRFLTYTTSSLIDRKKEKRQLLSKNFNRFQFFNTNSIQFAEKVNEEASVKSKTSSIVHSILHGSAATKEEDKHTHSKLIARGKYVHEFQSKFLIIIFI